MSPLALAARLAPAVWTCVLAGAVAAGCRRWLDRLPQGAAWSAVLLVALVCGDALVADRVPLPLGALRSSAALAGTAVESAPEGRALQSDLILQITPWLLRVRDDLRRGEWPLWNPFAGAGEPLWTNPQSQGAQPLVWAALVLPVERATGVLAALRVVLALWGAALFLRRLGAGGPAALAGGWVFALGGYLRGWTGWPLANAAALLPWLLYAVLRVEERGGRRDVGLLTGALACLLVSGHPETGVYALALGALFLAARAAGLSGAARRRLLNRAAAAAALASALAAPLLLPTARAVAASQRSVQLQGRGERAAASEGGEGPVAGAGGSAWTRAALLVAPLAAGDNFRGPYWGDRNILNDTAGFAGTAACLLLLASTFAAVGKHRPGERFFLAVAWIAALAIVRPPPVAWLMLHVPGLTYSASWHSRLSLWLDFGLAIVAGLVLDRFRARQPFADRRLLAVALVLAAAIVAAVVALHRSELMALRMGALLLQLATLAAAVGALVGLRRRPRAAWAVLAAVCVVEPALLRASDLSTAPLAAFYPESAPLEDLARRLRPGERMVAIGSTLRANLPTAYGLADPRIHDPGRPASYVEATSALAGPGATPQDPFVAADSPLYALLGVRYLVAPRSAPRPATWRGAGDFDRVRTYERAALPLLFFPAAAEPCAEPELWSPCLAPIDDFSARAVVRAGDPHLPWSAAGALATSSLDWRATRLRLAYRADGPRLLATSVFQDGGWRVLLDGSRWPATVADGPFVAAWVPAGEHVVTLLYRPVGFVAGALLAAGALAMGLVALAAPRDARAGAAPRARARLAA